MNIEILKNHRRFYRNSEAMGAAHILRQYLGLEGDFPIPLSLAHGVDMNHCSEAMDVQAAEPLHWSCNETVHQRAQKVKPSVLIPHPWLLLAEMKPSSGGTGVLVVGPPPGRSNDERLLARLQCMGTLPSAILLKKRGKLDDSMRFWQSHNIEPVSAGDPDEGFYERLYDLLGAYECIIGCTLSSALFFAAAIGKRCQIVTDYTYSAYDTADYLETVRFEADVASKFARQLVAGKFDEATQTARDVLGLPWMVDRVALKSRLVSAFSEIRYPVHVLPGGNVLSDSVRRMLARVTGRVGLLNRPWSDLFWHHRQNVVSIIEMNEVDIWLNGVSAANLHTRLVPYVHQLTEPGWAVD